jgi:enamine deaminase RidA (YjgF/YER057c/UK114 family)
VKPTINERINPPQIAGSASYSHVVVVPPGKKTLYISGQVSMDVKGNVVGDGDYEAQIRQAFKNLGYALESAGATFADVVMLNAYILSLEKGYDLYKKVRSEVLKGAPPPAATIVEVSQLAAPKLLIEIEAIAAV